MEGRGTKTPGMSGAGEAGKRGPRWECEDLGGGGTPGCGMVVQLF
jgi:hypothetical protein